MEGCHFEELIMSDKNMRRWGVKVFHSYTTTKARWEWLRAAAEAVGANLSRQVDTAKIDPDGSAQFYWATEPFGHQLDYVKVPSGTITVIDGTYGKWFPAVPGYKFAFDKRLFMREVGVPQGPWKKICQRGDDRLLKAGDKLFLKEEGVYWQIFSPQEWVVVEILIKEEGYRV
jgi:hypothetical protein